MSRGLESVHDGEQQVENDGVVSSFPQRFECLFAIGHDGTVEPGLSKKSAIESLRGVIVFDDEEMRHGFTRKWMIRIAASAFFIAANETTFRIVAAVTQPRRPLPSTCRPSLWTSAR